MNSYTKEMADRYYKALAKLKKLPEISKREECLSFLGLNSEQFSEFVLFARMYQYKITTQTDPDSCVVFEKLESTSTKISLKLVGQLDNDVRASLSLATDECNVVMIKFKDGNSVRGYPFWTLFIDGEDSVVFESITGKGLDIVPIDLIQNIEIEKFNYSPTHTFDEVKDFLNSLREHSDRCARLIIRISGGEDIDFSMLENQLLHHPYITVNFEGDYIWAATLEPNDTIYEWLFSMKDRIQILEPFGFIEEFLSYTIERNEHDELAC